MEQSGDVTWGNYIPQGTLFKSGEITSGERKAEIARPKKSWTKAGGNHLGPSRRNCTEALSV
jgi:hypothetical protein